MITKVGSYERNYSLENKFSIPTVCVMTRRGFLRLENNLIDLFSQFSKYDISFLDSLEESGVFNTSFCWKISPEEIKENNVGCSETSYDVRPITLKSNLEVKKKRKIRYSQQNQHYCLIRIQNKTASFFSRRDEV